MNKTETFGGKVFEVCNTVILALAAAVCVLPFIHILALSLSDNTAVMAGIVKLWPVHFTVEPYMYVLQRQAFWKAFGVSMLRVAVGVAINMFMVVVLAYPLSKPKKKFYWRTVYTWFFFFTMLFGGGLIPSYILVKYLGIMNTIWALVLPGAIPVFNIILMLNFFRTIPEEIEEAAFIDGASHWRTLWQIYLPVSLPAIATIALFGIVGHWNAWFDGLLYMKVTNYPLQSYLQTIIVNFDFQKMTPKELETLTRFNVRSVKSAQMIVATIPILMVYPYLQKYFVTGIVLGSVKG